ncbi:SDR family NAD(P)-dependent oxidoreductase [Cupriavidus sp. DL-D2]|uniref:type I polyketide synthase n=1 Tax=Cupriavidus sp. DL-D2 TaxID=3144974 RepID=UPI003214D1EA
MPVYETPTHLTGIEIAIVGMAGRFPDAPDVDAFWRNICNGVESVSTLSDAELAAAGVPPERIADPAYVKAGVRFEGFDRFDAAFFGYAPREAQYLDPQQRIFLECAWHAMEHAGYDVARLQAAVGVYAGAGANLYLMKHLLPQRALGTDAGIAELIGLMNGNASDALSTRVAYKLNLRGPALTVQTACSTSLVAVHQACQALLARECDMALAGGVWLNLLQAQGYAYQAGAILSSDGHCRAFDARADGTVLGSGAGVVALKRLEQALDDGDTIHAIIKATALNNDGANKVGYTAPSVAGQADAIGLAQMLADVSPDSIGYVEAHGTGTTLGDPIEIAALTQAFREGTQRRGFCAIGSVKTNIGHLDAAAGVAGLIKAVMALRHRTLPPSLHFETPNPGIDFASGPFFVNTRATHWSAGPVPRRAGVSSFGMGGTNAHAVLEEAPALRPAGTPSEGAQLLLLSARSESALANATHALAHHLDHQPDLQLADVAHTLAMGRKPFAHRAVVIASDLAQAAQALHARSATHLVSGAAADEPPSVAFLFPGQGAQHVGMARALYDTAPLFRSTVDACCERLREPLGTDLRQWIWPEDTSASPDASAKAGAELSRTALTQPALFVIEYALAKLWMSWGVQPAAMIGHSIGEYVAACLAGVFTLDDALALVAARGRLMQSTPPGAMLAVGLPESALTPWIEAGCDLAAVNAPELCVLAGTVDAIGKAEQALLAQGAVVRRLHVSHAFHSALLDPVIAEFEAVVGRLTLRAPSIPYVSNVTGDWITAAQACDPRYWAEHLRGTVRFAAGLGRLLERADCIALEVGPGDTLTSLVKRHPLAEGRMALSTLPHARREDLQALQHLRCLGQLWTAGVDIDVALAERIGPARRRIPLPGYPFEHRSFWVDAPAVADKAPGIASGPCGIDDWFHVPTWQRVTLPAASSAQEGCTVVLGGSGSVDDRVLQRLAGMGTVASIAAGATYARLDAHHHVAPPADAEALADALRAIGREVGAIARICCLWTLDSAHGMTSLVALARAIEAAPASRAPGRLVLQIVTQGLADVTGTEPLDPDRALLLGPALVMPQELQDVVCGVVDIEVPASGSFAETRLVTQLCDALHDAEPLPMSAYRGPHRWVRGYEALRHAPDSPVCLRKGGTYLITGGLGGVGLTLARYLAEHWQARLVLLQRSALPPRTDWAARIADASQPQALRERLAALQSLASLGAEVMTLTADVTDATAMRVAVSEARQMFGTLHGVIHAAGASADAYLSQWNAEQSARVLAPKVDGARHLLAALQGQQPDFVLLCSSLASIAGGIGRADYAAANAWLDARATAALRDASFPVIAVNWDGWRDVGMAAAMALPEGVGIPAVQGGAALERVLSGPPRAQVLVVTTDLTQRLRGVDLAMFDTLDTLGASRSSRPQHPRPALGVPYVAAEDDLSQGLAALFGELVGVAPVGIHDNLFELGGDSLLAIQLLARVRAAWGVSVRPVDFFKTPTVEALAVLVELLLIEQIAQDDTPDTAATLPV